MTERKFYKATFTVEVLSEEPLDGSQGLGDLHYMIMEGPCSGRFR